MSVRVIADGRYAMLYDSVSMTGLLCPVFTDMDGRFESPEAAALDFLEWEEERHGDPRHRSGVDLAADVGVWRSWRQPPVQDPAPYRDHHTTTVEDAARWEQDHEGLGT